MRTPIHSGDPGCVGLFRDAAAHPLGNFSVNHYMRFDAVPGGVEMRYAMDLAEIPTFELLRSWGMERTSPREDLNRKAIEQARIWMGKLAFEIDGKPVKPTFEDAALAIIGRGRRPSDPADYEPDAHPREGRTMQYEDHNFEGRAGWKEIVIAAAPGVRLESASQTIRIAARRLRLIPRTRWRRRRRICGRNSCGVRMPRLCTAAPLAQLAAPVVAPAAP